MAAYKFLTVEKLKTIPRERGGSTRGRKIDLIDRLESYDRNRNFGPEPIQLPAPIIPNWPTSGYKQLTLDHKDVIPPVRKEFIESYFVHRQMNDKKAAGDLKSIEKGTDLVRNNKIDACSFLAEDGVTFFTGIVSAAMKKNVSYNYKVSLNSRGEIRNSHCECPAGKGPHGLCKHVAAVCLMLVHLKEHGEVKTSLSCTDQLQVFHHPSKRHTGSPVKAEQLDVPSLKRTRLVDPRLKYRGMSETTDLVHSFDYTAFVHNRMINYGSLVGKKDLGIRYTWGKANIQEAVFDHQYLKLPFTEYWVDEANKVTEDDARRIEKSTRDQSSCNQWFEERQWRLTASMFGSISKITDRCDIRKFCERMYNPPLLAVPAVLHGRQNEQAALDKFQQMTGKKVRKCGVFVSTSHPYLAATPDGIVMDSNPLEIVEVKCPYNGREDNVLPGENFPFLKNCAEKVCINERHSYYDQVQGQMFITGSSLCHFVVYTYVDCKIFTVSFDEEQFKVLLTKLENFYLTHYRKYVAQQL